MYKTLMLLKLGNVLRNSAGKYYQCNTIYVIESNKKLLSM